MTTHAPRAPDLAALLERHHDEITEAWAKSSQQIPGSRYGDHSVSAIQSWLSPETSATVATLATGSYGPTEDYLRATAEGCLAGGFGISEVIENLMLFREAALPFILRAFPPGDPELDRVLTALDAYLRFKVGRFGRHYAEAVDQELRRNEQRFRTVADFAYDWEYWVDGTGSYVYVSPSCERITGYRAEEFHADARLLEKIIHRDDRKIYADHLRQKPRADSPLLPLEFRVLRRDGEERWLEHVCQPVYDASGGYLGWRGSNRDVTERKRMEEEIAQHVRDRAAVAERSRLARELHDSVTQTLYSANLHAEAASLALASGNTDVVTASLQKLQRMTREAMTDLRMLIFELHPPALQEQGLAAALRARLSTVETRAGLQSEIGVEGEESLPLPVAEELFWIAVEAFNNVLKHANARKVTVSLVCDGPRVELTIADDGQGFDPDSARSGSGTGLRSIAERVERIGGRLSLVSAPGQGTTVTIEAQA